MMYIYGEAGRGIKDVYTYKECQWKCQQLPFCNFFTYTSSKSKSKGLKNMCWPKVGLVTQKQFVDAVSGPKYCNSTGEKIAKPAFMEKTTQALSTQSVKKVDIVKIGGTKRPQLHIRHIYYDRHFSDPVQFYPQVVLNKILTTLWEGLPCTKLKCKVTKSVSGSVSTFLPATFSLIYQEILL